MQEHQLRLVMKLSSHVGVNNAVNMAALFEHVYGEPVRHLVNDTRRLRKLVQKVRNEGVPICSLTHKNEGGYYLASAGSELDDYCNRLRRGALKKLVMEAKLRKLGLPELLGQISLNLQSS